MRAQAARAAAGHLRTCRACLRSDLLAYRHRVATVLSQASRAVRSKIEKNAARFEKRTPLSGVNLHIRDPVFLAASIRQQAMNEPLSPNVCRRDLLRMLTAGAGAAAAGSAGIAVAAAQSTSADKKQRARYQPDSPDIRNFYRVNRYPSQR